MRSTSFSPSRNGEGGSLRKSPRPLFVFASEINLLLPKGHLKVQQHHCSQDSMQQSMTGRPLEFIMVAKL